MAGILRKSVVGCIMKFSEVRWKKVGLAIGVGFVAMMAATAALANWQWQQGICIRFYPDGSEKMFYGKDCESPSQAPAASETI